MNHSQRRLLSLAITLSGVYAAQCQDGQSPIYSFTGYYESIHGTLSYYPSTVHWSYLHGEDGESIDGLRLTLPYEETSNDYEISELWGNDQGIIFICGEMTVLVIKNPSSASKVPLITLSKTAELQVPPAQRSYYQYFSLDHSFEPSVVAMERSIKDL